MFLLVEIGRLGKRLGVRQQAIATAQVYIRRFYSKVEIRKTNPYLVIATAVYLACKMEECPHHIRLVVSEGRALWPGKFFYTAVIALLTLLFHRILHGRHLQIRGMRILLNI